MIFAFLSFIWAFFLEPNNIIGFFIICLLSGIAVGANLALPSAIIAEDINSNNNQDYASSVVLPSMVPSSTQRKINLVTGTLK